MPSKEVFNIDPLEQDSSVSISRIEYVSFSEIIETIIQKIGPLSEYEMICISNDLRIRLRHKAEPSFKIENSLEKYEGENSYGVYSLDFEGLEAFYKGLQNIFEAKEEVDRSCIFLSFEKKYNYDSDEEDCSMIISAYPKENNRYNAKIITDLIEEVKRLRKVQNETLAREQEKKELEAKSLQLVKDFQDNKVSSEEFNKQMKEIYRKIC